MIGDPFRRARSRNADPTGPERDAATEERMLASVGYLIWPLACTILLSIGSVSRSAWLKKHAIQAIIFGVTSWCVMFFIFSLPLFIIMNSASGYESTIGVYQFFFVIDAIVFSIAFTYAIIAARCASRGEEFSLVTLLKKPLQSWKLATTYQRMIGKFQTWRSSQRHKVDR